ncbi:MAG: recombinase family protein [Ruminococcus sp.]|nr:recombinase family protein [Ruminococcus sp.]
MEKQKRIVFGYTRDCNKNIVLYKEQARYVKLIFQAYAAGATLSQIAWALNSNDVPSPKNKSTWGRPIINNILSNAKYLGDEDYPQIIEQALWDDVQMRKQNSAYSRRYHSDEDNCEELLQTMC